MTSVAPIDTRAAVEWYRRNRARSEAIFDLIDPSAYYSRPISLRNPIVFYEGHLLAFSVIAFLRRGLGLLLGHLRGELGRLRRSLRITPLRLRHRQKSDSPSAVPGTGGLAHRPGSGGFH